MKDSEPAANGGLARAEDIPSKPETRVGDLNQSLGAALPDGGDFETLGGLLNATAGAIPQTGDRFFIGGLELTVVQRDDRRARLVRIARPKTAPPPVKK